MDSLELDANIAAGYETSVYDLKMHMGETFIPNFIKEFGVEANDSSVACCVPTVTSTKKPLSITIKAEANKCCSGNNPEKTSC